MAKKKKKTPQGQQFLSDEQYLRQRARTLPIGKCYISEDFEQIGVYCIIVTRKHTGGRLSMALFVVDMMCLGVKRTSYHLRMEDYELEENVLDTSDMDFHECSYEEAHNRIYGSIAFAEEAGIKPAKGFYLTQYLLEEDTEDVPLIEYEYGKNGKHLLICETRLEATRYLPLLIENLGEGNFDYVIAADEKDNSNDEDIDYKAEPKTIAERLSETVTSKNLVSVLANTLGYRLNPVLDQDQAIEAYVKTVLANPVDILTSLPAEDLEVLEKLKETKPENNVVRCTYNNRLMMMEYLGFGWGDWTDDGDYVFCVTTDFAKAMLPHLEEAKGTAADKTRLVVESYTEGMANLYGEVRLDFLKKRLTDYLHLDSTDRAEEIIDMAYKQSILLRWMRNDIDDGADDDDAPLDKTIYFVSRYGEEDPDFTHERINSKNLPDTVGFKLFPHEDVLLAGNIIPIIPNEQAKAFYKLLREKFNYRDEMTILEICHDIWYRAMHEGDDDFEENSCEEYFNDEVIAEAQVKLTDKQIAEAHQQLKDYLDAMPRWTLRGHAVNEKL